MHLISISDLHGRISKIDRLKDAALNADLLVVSGDITHFGGRQQAEEVLAELLKINKNIVGVPGNCDKEGVNKTLMDAGMSIHGAGRIIKNIGFFGAGGSTATPFDTPQEYPEEKFEEFLKQGYKTVKNCEKTVLVSHSPPFGTLVDKTKSGEHVGSKLLRAFVEDVKPDLVLCGHAHEARGHDKLGRTLVINPGPLHMGCVKVDLSSLSFEFIDF